MAFDYKKAFREFYLPKQQPEIITVPAMKFVAVQGCGDPNALDGAYSSAISVLYAVAYTIKMSRMGDRRIDGYFDFVVPPLEGFWTQDGGGTIDYAHKDGFRWLSCIRLPDFVTRDDFDWAVAEAGRKKKLDCTGAEYRIIEEGLCVQMLHVGSYDGEPASIARMNAYIREQGYAEDFSTVRQHHEIYLSDPRKVPPERLKTVIRHPIKRA